MTWEGPPVTENDRPADETGHGTDRTAGADAGWAPPQPAGSPPQPQPHPPAAQRLGAEAAGTYPTQQFPAAPPVGGPQQQPHHQPWPPAGYGTPGYQQGHGSTGAGTVPPAFLPPVQPGAQAL